MCLDKDVQIIEKYQINNLLLSEEKLYFCAH